MTSFLIGALLDIAMVFAPMLAAMLVMRRYDKGGAA